MRIAIFSDVHGNLAALSAVLADIDRRPGIEQVVFAGDLCLFGPRPQECLNLIRQRTITSLVGNTDEWILQPPRLPDDLDEQTRIKRQRVIDLCNWTAAQMAQDDLSWLKNLCSVFQYRLSPGDIPEDDLLIVHANPLDIAQLIFPSLERQLELYGRVRQPDEDLAPLFHGTSEQTVAFGHLHVPGVRRWQDKQLVNISSVSLPGDGDGRAKYAILSWQKVLGWSAEFIFLPYPIDQEIDAYKQMKPPGWQDRVRQFETLGTIPQIV